MITAGSPSLNAPEYWWYTARARLLQTVLEPYAAGARRVLDVGSADGPSVGWLAASDLKVAMDIDPRGLVPGGVCGSATALPFADASFDVVAAFDVIEHCAPEALALSEAARVLAPGGVFLMSVPAYQWAWTDFDEANHHHRRYTRRRAVDAVTRAGFRVERATYAFGATFPAFAADRLPASGERAPCRRTRTGRHRARAPAGAPAGRAGAAARHPRRRAVAAHPRPAVRLLRRGRCPPGLTPTGLSARRARRPGPGRASRWRPASGPRRPAAPPP